METLKVKPWASGQGDHVLINKSDFDPKLHSLLDAPEVVEKKPAPAVVQPVIAPAASSLTESTAAPALTAAPAPTATPKLTAKHKGRGLYVVTDEAGTVVATGLDKAAAQAMVAGE